MASTTRNDIRALTDQQLLAEVCTANQEASSDAPTRELDWDAEVADLNAEITRRFGPSAHDNLAEYFTASHASPDDQRRMAIEETDLLVSIANGTHTHDAIYGVCCRCGWSPLDDILV